VSERNTLNNNFAAPGAKVERDHNRWLLVAYDILQFLFCWVLVFVCKISISNPLQEGTAMLYLAVGMFLFFGFRFAFRGYKQILRYGTMRAFARELAADLLGGAGVLGMGGLLNYQFKLFQVPFSSLVAFVAGYIVLSITTRVAYCYLYHLATKKYWVSRVVRLILERVTLVDFASEEPGAILHLSLQPEKQSDSPINELKNIAEQFVIHGDITSITQINKGYINRTYRVETLSAAGHVHKYTLQRINTHVFPDVDALMANFKLTTDHLAKSFLLPGHRDKGSVQTVRLTKSGEPYLKDPSGCWRLMTYFDDVYSLDLPDSPETFFHAGNAFGKFLKEMSDVDVSQVKEVIPNFHNTLSRYRDLEKAILADTKNRVKNVADEIEFIRANATWYGKITDALESGEIPTRVCHNDCNLNNILFDNETRLPVAVIDLDTVMPASPLYDFGDSMRIGTNTAKDDEKDLSKVSCNLHLYEQYARGYLAACGDILTRQELELMPYAAMIITVEDGIRFLTDYLMGDIYFNIYYPEQNLDRSRTQLKLVEDMETKLPEIKEILKKIYAELGLEAELD